MSPPGKRRARSPRVLDALLLCILLLPAASSYALEPGDTAPLFSLPTLAGEEAVSLSSYRGKVVYLDFWASWCVPCLTSLPLLESLDREFPDERFQVLAINLDDDPAKARRFLDKLGVTYPSGIDPEGRTPEKFEIQTMPTSFLIDGGGVIRHVHEGFRKGDVEGLRNKIQALVTAGGR